MTHVPGFSNDLFLGKQIVVTDAAGGIGRAIAAAFAACGAGMVRFDRHEAIPTEERGRIDCDLADRKSLQDAAARITGPVAALVNCAGVFRRMPLAAAGAKAEWDRTLAINLTAPFLLNPRRR
jgi:3-oxoacyl-[acyl-carrier protein] reductase